MSPIACSGEVDIDGYFLEYDTDRAGGFEPLRFVAEGQEADRARACDLEERHAGEKGRHQAAHRGGDEICRHRSVVPLPQCGFASTEEGNVLAEDEQWAKLRMIAELADDVWGR